MKRSRLLYLAILLFSLLFIYFYGGKIPYMLFYTVILLPVFSYLYTYFIYTRIKFTQSIDRDMIMKGENVNFTLTFYNNDLILYPYISVALPGNCPHTMEESDEIRFSLPPLKKRAFKLQMEFDYRGTFEIGIDAVRLEDFMGLFRFEYKVQERKKVTVNPRVIKLESFALKSSLAAESKPVRNNISEDNASMCDIREYQYGDSMKKIHWKLTSKSEELLVKQFESSSEIYAMLLLDLVPCSNAGENRIIIEDKLIEAAVAIANYCLNNWIATSVMYFENDLVRIDAVNNLMFPAIYNALAGVGFNHRVPVGNILGMQLNGSITRSNVLVLTSNLDFGLCDKLVKSGNAGYDTCLLYVSPSQLPGAVIKDEDYILEYLGRNGVTSLKLNVNDDLKEQLESLKLLMN